MVGLPLVSDQINRVVARLESTWFFFVRIRSKCFESRGNHGFLWISMDFYGFLETWSGERSAELVSTSETRNPKPETPNRLSVKVGFELRNPKPETRNRLWRLNFPRTDRNPKPEARNPKPETDSEDPSPGPIETRNPKTRNPKPTLKT